MIRCIVIISISVFFYSCKESTPSGIIKPKKMQEVLWDVLKADALSQQLVKSDSAKSLADESVKLTKKVFLIHNISEEQFEKSYTYYTNHPDIMRTMLDSINAQQTRKSNLEIPLTKKRMLKDTVSNK
jgi:ribosome-binding ATPase YchF (GTP1/OBG family)